MAKKELYIVDAKTSLKYIYILKFKKFFFRQQFTFYKK